MLTVWGKVNFDPSLTPYTNINSRSIIGQKLKGTTVNLLEEKVSSLFWGEQIFLERTQRSDHKEKYKFNFMEI